MRLSATASPVEAVEWVFEARKESRGGVVEKTVAEHRMSMPYRCWEGVSWQYCMKRKHESVWGKVKHDKR